MSLRLFPLATQLSRRLLRSSSELRRLLSVSPEASFTSEVKNVEHSLVAINLPPFVTSPQYQLPLDTYHWVRSLDTGDSACITRAQVEALLEVVQSLAAFKLGDWHSSLAASPRLHQDLHILRALTHDLSVSAASSNSCISGATPSSSLPMPALTKLENEQRSRHERLQTELHLVADQLRDLVTAVRTDLALIVNGYRAEAKEDTQKMELDLHKLDAKLATAVSSFKGQAEQVKLKALYTFASTISPCWW